MSDLVENPEDRFSHNEAHLVTESVLMGSILFCFPEHALCSNANGGCSDFCLPNEAGGRTCACEEYTELLVDEKTCESRKYSQACVHIKQDIFLAFQTGGSLFLHESSVESS